MSDDTVTRRTCSRCGHTRTRTMSASGEGSEVCACGGVRIRQRPIELAKFIARANFFECVCGYGSTFHEAAETVMCKCGRSYKVPSVIAYVSPS